jgi:hypothetical protein
MPNQIFISSTETQLSDAPIPAAWVRAGAPHARCAELSRSRDGTAAGLMWDCTAGEFDWFFGVDEWVHIVEGSVHVRDEEGQWRTLTPGSVALFRAGCWSRWRVDDYVRKLAICRTAGPVSLGAVLRLFARLRAEIMRRRKGPEAPERRSA